MKEKLREIIKQFRPYDFILVGLAILLSFLPMMFTAGELGKQASEPQVIARVKIHGEVVDEFILSKDGGHQEKTYYPNEGQYNIIEIDNDRIRVKEDNSPDQIAVLTSWISAPGEISVCLPHQLMIEIVSTASTEEDESEASEELILPL